MTIHQAGSGALAFLVPLAALLAVMAIPVGIVLVVFGLVRYFRPAAETSEAVLARRYAAGEISRSEYAALRRDLGLPPLPEDPS